MSSEKKMFKSLSFVIPVLGTFLGVFVLGCNSYSEQTKARDRTQEEARAARIAYVESHREDINQVSEEFTQKETLELFRTLVCSYMAALPEVNRKLLETVMEMVVYGEDSNVAVTKIVETMYEQRPRLSSEDRDELVGMVTALIRSLRIEIEPLMHEIGMSELFELAIERGHIMEGMTLEQVRIAWNEYDLSFQYSDLSGYAGYEVQAVPQELHKVDSHGFSVFGTVPSESVSISDPLYKDYHLTFKDGKLVDLMSFSDRSELARQLVELRKEMSHSPANKQDEKFGDQLFFSDKNEFARALAQIRKEVLGNGKGKQEEDVETRTEQHQETAREYERIGVTKVRWKEIARWKGNGIKHTETFNISVETWRISWETKPTDYSVPLFQIWVYNSKDRIGEDIPVAIAANVLADVDSSSSIMRGSGDFYLMINTALTYIVIVEEKI